MNTPTARLSAPTLDVTAQAYVQVSTVHTAQGRKELIRTLMLFKREFIIVGLLSAAANLLMLTPTLYMLQVYDRVMISQNALTLVSVSLITLALFGIMALAEWGRSRLLVATGLRLDDELSTRVFNASFESHLAGAQTPGRSPARAFNDLLQVRQFITGNGVFAFFDLPWAPIYIGVMFLLHPFLGWLSILFALIQGLTAWLGHRHVLQPAEAAQQAQLEANQFLAGKLRNAEVLESMGMVGNLRGPWLRRHHEALALAGTSQATTHRITAISKFMRYTMQSLSLGAGALLVIQGELTGGAMIAANVLMTRALAPIDMLVAIWRSYITARESFLRLSDLLAEHPERDPALQRARPQGALKVQQLTATAPGRSAPILQNIDFELPAGQVLVVLGPSGSGKSTLARAMMGIWGQTQGSVTLDGVPIDTWDRERLGPHVGYLPQDIELFDGTIAENIARMAQVDPQKVIDAAKAAGLHDMILRFPKGYDTPMGEAGSMLSGGQRQRVALARALYGQPALVVLDEPNANLDDAGEAALARAVMGLKQAGSTVVLVTHRPGAIGLADRLLVLQAGQVRLYGPRDEVLRALRPQPAPQPTPQAPVQPAASNAADAP